MVIDKLQYAMRMQHVNDIHSYPHTHGGLIVRLITVPEAREFT